MLNMANLVGKGIDAPSVSCHRVTMEVKIIVRTILSRAKNLVKETHKKLPKTQLEIFSSLKFCKRAVITGVGGTLLCFFDHFYRIIVKMESNVKVSL